MRKLARELWGKRAARWVAAAGVLLLAVTVAYAAQVPNTFVDGTVASAKAVNDNFKYLADRVVEPSFGVHTIAAVITKVTGDCGAGTTTIGTVSLPVANATYLVTAHVRASFHHKAPATGWPSAWIQAMLHDTQKNATVPESEVLIVSSSLTDQTLQTTGSMSVFITTTAANHSLQLRACRSANGTWVASNILSNTGGRTKIVYRRVK